MVAWLNQPRALCLRPAVECAMLKKINQFHFDIISGCQLSCVGCPTPVQKEKIHAIDPETFRHCLNNVDVQRVDVLRLFNFGEPLLHPNLTKIGEVLADIRHIKFDIIEISTNAQRCNWEDFENLLKLGVVGRIAVSCDGDATAESYEQLRPPAKWHKLLDFFDRCATAVAKYSPETKMMTRTVISSVECIPKWENLLTPFGFVPEFRGWKILPEASLNMTGRAVEPAEGICFFVEDQTKLFVNAYGDVVPCCVHPKAGHLGSLRVSKFSEILAGRQRREFVDELLSARRGMKICGTCEFGPRQAPGKSAGQNLPPG